MNSQSKQKFSIRTLGCKVNQYESQAMRELLLESGFEEVSSKEAADVYVINTCTVTADADKESRYLVNLCRRTNPQASIAVTGCYVEMDAHEIALIPGVSHIIKNSDKPRIADILNNKLTAYGLRPATTPVSLPKISDFKNHSKAYVKIQDGCENRCSYCKVPLVRSHLKSKFVNDISEEIAGLVRNGFKEVVLTGICLGAWGKDLFPEEMIRRAGLKNVTVLDALKAINRLSGDFRIRLSSIEPKYVTDELIDFIAASGRICKHLHIPLQSGDDDVLGAMNRPYTAKKYKALIDKIRKTIPDIAITTDVLIGFPAETTPRFKNTLAFVKEIAPARTHIFTFSRRNGTPAYSMAGEADQYTLKKRYHQLNAAALGLSYLYRRNFLGKELDVLVETKRDTSSGLLKGYSGNYIKVHFDARDELMRKIVPVRVNDLNLIRTEGVYAG